MKENFPVDVIIIGAGASGLMAARELSKSRSVIILEAKDRIGGRIWPINDPDFDMTLPGGAEFVHGEAKVTKNLVKEAGLTYLPMEGEVWRFKQGRFTQDDELFKNANLFRGKRKEMKEDMPIADFLEKYFNDSKYDELRQSVQMMVEDFDAADPKKISTFTLLEEWLGGDDWQQGKIKEGYQALLNYLQNECQKNGVTILTSSVVAKIEITKDGTRVICQNGSEFSSKKVLVTLSLPTISDLEFNPPIPEKIKAISEIGFGSVIKIFLKFKENWWKKSRDTDLSKLMFMISDEAFSTWWPLYPSGIPMLTGWVAGPNVEKMKNLTDEQIISLGLDSLSKIFAVDRERISSEIVAKKVINWPADPFAKGAYSYSTPNSDKASRILSEPIQNKIFFAGEALYQGKETATVEGALASGLEVAKKLI